MARPLGLLLGEPLHFLMQTRQFHNLRKRVRGGAVRRTPISGGHLTHQGQHPRLPAGPG